MRLVAGKPALRLENCAALLGGAIIFACGRLSIFTKMKDVFWLCPLTLGGIKQHLEGNVI
jgi:hypothetical protein